MDFRDNRRDSHHFERLCPSSGGSWTMQRQFSPCTRHQDILESQGDLEDLEDLEEEDIGLL
jgi:hypothetical protein